MRQLKKIHSFHIFNRRNPVPVYLSWGKKKVKDSVPNFMQTFMKAFYDYLTLLVFIRYIYIPHKSPTAFLSINF